MPMLKLEVEMISPNFPLKAYFPALIELESCVGLRNSRCWDPSSQLKTTREEGAGLGQITKAYRTDGTLRFDALTEMKNKHNEYLKDLSWNNVYSRPDLQMRILLLKSSDDYANLRTVKDPIVRIHFADAAYNGGLGGVYKERTACGLKSNCNPQLWFGNVEKVCLKSKVPIYGQRNACDINRAHVEVIFTSRIWKYKKYFPDAI